MVNQGKNFHSGRDKSLTSLVQGRNKPNIFASKALVFTHMQSASEIPLGMVALASAATRLRESGCTGVR